MKQIFLSQSIFNNYSANNFCDNICALIMKDDEYFPKDFALSGRASYELQRPTSTSLKNLIFVTWNLDSYLKLASELQRFNITNYLRYNEKLKFKYLAGSVNLCVEIHFLAKEVNTVDYNSIRLVSLSQIPNELLV